MRANRYTHGAIAGLPKVPKRRARRSRERQPGSEFPTGRGTGDGHLEAHHDLQATPARPGKAAIGSFLHFPFLSITSSSSSHLLP
ncbi:hypothetical protein CCACVL1_08696 [Corchorus capsularis]|uniref:Uncharacterized protein n=1 Tax=Corchorus capsularis TaxID=210143 RepID=A0A1R3IZ99_COCAP|nr:hypothetical protein CCACVL1_08696 [Corchorus capsularis]